MNRLASTLWGRAGVVFVSLTFWPRISHAQAATKQQCISAYTDAQRHRRSGELLRARTELRVCASDPCPVVLQDDCGPWLAEVDHLVPSIILGARDASGHDLFDASVTVDGKPLVSRLDGRPVDVDPGDHTVRFESQGHEAVEQRVLVREGEKARIVSVTMNATTIPAPAMNAKLEEAHDGARPVPTATWIFGGASAAAFATAAGAGIIGFSKWNRCHDGGCSRSDQSFSDSVNTVGNVALVVGAVSLVAAAYFFITRPTIAAPHANSLPLRIAF